MAMAEKMPDDDDFGRFLNKANIVVFLVAMAIFIVGLIYLVVRIKP